MAELNRNFIISSDITTTGLESLMKSLLEIHRYDNEQFDKLKEYKPKPIHLNIESFGGCMYTSIGITNLMLEMKTKIITEVYGKAMSGGLLMFMAGDVRRVHWNATLMYHQAASGMNGKHEAMKERMDWNMEVRKKYMHLFHSRTKVSKKRFKKVDKLKQDWFMGAEEALELGFATEIIGGK